MTRGQRNRIGRILVVVAGASTLVAAAAPAPAVANSAWWRVSASSRPTYLPPGGEATIVVTAANLGNAQASGGTTPIILTDKLPEGVTPTAIATRAGMLGGLGELECAPLPAVACSFTGALQPYEQLELEVTVSVQPGAATSSPNEVTVSGGELATTKARQTLTVKDGPIPFGVESYRLAAEDDSGSSDTQAGSHPYQLTTGLSLTTKTDAGQTVPAALAKDLRFDLPSGLTGNPNAVPQCTDLQFSTLVVFTNRCPAGSQVGVAMVTIREPSLFGSRPLVITVPVFNLVPNRGEPARFGFEAISAPVVLNTALRTGKDYGVVVTADDIAQSAEFLGSQITLWGVPGDARHDASRGWHCVAGGFWNSLIGGSCTTPEPAPATPFLTLPTSCTGPLRTTVTADSWKQPDAREVFPASEPLPGLDGCEHLTFDPSIQVQPEASQGSTPTGLTFAVHVPRAQDLVPTGLAAPAVKDTTVALPEGMQLNPAAADGLQACTENQIGFQGSDGGGTSQFTPMLPSPFCPDASKVGTAYIKSPLLKSPLEGAVYLAAQNANPFGSLVAMYIFAEDPVSGVVLRLAGEVKLSETGRILATFDNTPDLPFEDLKLHFFGGPRAPLSTPSRCGAHTTAASFTPWSGHPPAARSPTFAITSGPNGSPCSNPIPFAPSLTAGATNIQADAFTPFTTTMSRQDGNQNLAAITLHMPAGLLGKLASINPCQEPQAAQGTCGPESLIGHTVTSVGLGPDPYNVPGTVYITGPYRGAPYGLSLVTPAVAGPFNLGTVVVRAKIEVNVHTSALTVVSGPLPSILQGVPLQIKRVNVAIDRPGFTFNPTNCSQLPITATLTGEQGATAPVSVPFEVANCATLPFKPKFTVLTHAMTSKVNGAYLHVNVTSGPGQANIGKVKVDLPKQLPSRLTTLQKACPDATFNANPALCAPGSVIGTATAVTPVLRSPLTGPAYLVSHAGTAFPDLVIVLQSEGITLDVVGNTDIKNGITISTFNAVPDAPIATFDLVLPEGPHSVLGANIQARAKGSLCRQVLAMPTLITGQNGAVLRQTTKIAVSGCPRRKARRAGSTKRGNTKGTVKSRKR
jgi:hypothetical protein